MINFFEITGDMRPVPAFLPVTLDELSALGYECPDFVLVTGDAYVDHPSFGAALIGKLLWAKGYSVGVIAMPDIGDPEAFAVFGSPRLAFLVTSGSVDSMVNNYTAAKKRRRTDCYAPSGKSGLRPDRAVIAYGKAIKNKYPNAAVIIGGLEASLRRMAHYDYWSDSVRPSILLESGADLLIYGMGERQTLEVAEALAAGVSVLDINYVDGTVFKTTLTDSILPEDVIKLPDFAKVKANKRDYAESFRVQYQNASWMSAKPLVEPYAGFKTMVVQNPPAAALVEHELDNVFGIFFSRAPHPSYKEGVQSIQEVRFSIISNRGCFGGCNFCALSFHQGRQVTSRSHESILAEAKALTELPDFKGYIHDVGGPTANFKNPSCQKQLTAGVCPDKRCLAPEPCKNLEVSHNDYLELLRKLRKLPGVKKVFIRSGIRFDYLMMDKDGAFFNELAAHHISGQLKVAPEHVSDTVLRRMGKPPKRIFDGFVKRYAETNRRLGLNQFLVPYLMSSHPGSGLKEAVELAEYLRDNHMSPEQVQDFYPTPGTVSTCMYHTGLDPMSMEPVYIPKKSREKAMQRALIQYKNPKNKDLVLEALKLTGRQDLIGFGPKCLVRPK